MSAATAMTRLFRIALGVQVCVLLLYSLLWGRQLLLKDSPRRADLIIFQTAGSIVAAGQGDLLYDVATQTSHQQRLSGGGSFESGLLPFNYPPHMALPGALLARCPLTAGYILWSVLQTGLLVAAVVMLRAVWGAWAPREQLMCVMTALSLWPAFWSIALGNVSVLILFCMLCAWRLQRAGRCGLAGGALALATGKPQLGLPFLAGQMAARRWRLLGSAGVIVALLTAASVAVIGLRGVLGYTDMVALVAGRTSGYSIHPEKMINLRGLAWVLSGNAALTRGVTWVGWMFALILIWRLWAPAAGASRTPAPREDWRWATTCVLALLASPHLYPHDLCLLLPAGVVLYDRLRGSAAASAAGLALAALNLVWIAVEPLRVAPLLGCAVMAAMLAGLWLVRPDRHTEQTVGCGQSWGECTHERPAITEGAS